MPQAETVDRIYSMDDLVMLLKAQSFHDNFVIDSVALIAAMPGLAAPFITDFQGLIDTADAIPSNEEEQSWITLKVSEINNLSETIRAAIQECYLYVKTAFGDDQAYNKVFGRGKDYTNAIGSHIKTKELVEKVHRVCETTGIKAPMIAAGFTQIKIDNLETLMNDLDTLITELENLKTDRLLKTRTRILAYNAVWESMVRISDAAKIAFATNETKLEIYQLYSTPPTTPHKVQGLAYNAGLNKLTWDVAENATLYIVEAMQQFPLSEPTFTMRAETPTTEWIVALPPATYSFRIKGKNGGESGPYSDSLDNNVIP